MRKVLTHSSRGSSSWLRALRSLSGWLRSSACARRTVPNPRGPSVLACPGEGGISVTNMALGGIFRLALNLFLSHERSEDRIHSELHVAKVFERTEGILVAD